MLSASPRHPLPKQASAASHPQGCLSVFFCGTSDVHTTSLFIIILHGPQLGGLTLGLPPRCSQMVARAVLPGNHAAFWPVASIPFTSLCSGLSRMLPEHLELCHPITDTLTPRGYQTKHSWPVSLSAQFLTPRLERCVPTQLVSYHSVQTGPFQASLPFHTLTRRSFCLDDPISVPCESPLIFPEPPTRVPGAAHCSLVSESLC